MRLYFFRLDIDSSRIVLDRFSFAHSAQCSRVSVAHIAALQIEPPIQFIQAQNL